MLCFFLALCRHDGKIKKRRISGVSESINYSWDRAEALYS